VNISREIRKRRKKSRNSSIRPVITHSRPPIYAQQGVLGKKQLFLNIMTFFKKVAWARKLIWDLLVFINFSQHSSDEPQRLPLSCCCRACRIVIIFYIVILTSESFAIRFQKFALFTST
jgi:hypothetical protein